MKRYETIAFFFFSPFKFFLTRPVEDVSQTNSALALFAVQNTLENDEKKECMLKPKAPFGRRKKLPATGSVAKVPTNRRMMKNELWKKQN
jgi:hypothetical protein